MADEISEDEFNELERGMYCNLDWEDLDIFMDLGPLGFAEVVTDAVDNIKQLANFAEEINEHLNFETVSWDSFKQNNEVIKELIDKGLSVVAGASCGLVWQIIDLKFSIGDAVSALMQKLNQKVRQRKMLRPPCPSCFPLPLSLPPSVHPIFCAVPGACSQHYASCDFDRRDPVRQQGPSGRRGR